MARAEESAPHAVTVTAVAAAAILESPGGLAGSGSRARSASILRMRRGGRGARGPSIARASLLCYSWSLKVGRKRLFQEGRVNAARGSSWLLSLERLCLEGRPIWASLLRCSGLSFCREDVRALLAVGRGWKLPTQRAWEGWQPLNPTLSLPKAPWLAGSLLFCKRAGDSALQATVPPRRSPGGILPEQTRVALDAVSPCKEKGVHKQGAETALHPHAKYPGLEAIFLAAGQLRSWVFVPAERMAKLEQAT